MEEKKEEELRKLAELLKEFYYLVGHSTNQETLSILYESQLTIPQIITLHYLFYCKEASVSSIAERLNLSLGATSHLVDRLVRSGYVVRTENVEDRRIKSISLTEKGLDFIRRINESRTDEIIKNLSLLDVQNIGLLSDNILKVVQKLRNMKGEVICRKE